MSDTKIKSARALGGSPQLNPTRRDRPITAAEKQHCITIYDHDNTDSVWYRASGKLKQALDDVPKYIKTWSLKAIEKALGDKLTIRDKQIRISFWREYHDAIDAGRMMSTSAITRGICDHKYLYETLVYNSKKMAYVLYPPADYNLAMGQLLDQSTQELREILQMSNYAKDGQPNATVINSKIKIHQMIENRVRGMAPKTLNINQKSLNVNVNKKETESQKLATTMSNEEIENELTRLQKEIKKLPPAEAANNINHYKTPAVEVSANDKNIKDVNTETESGKG